MKKAIIITWIIIIGLYVGNFFLVKNYLDVPAEDQCIFGHDLQKCYSEMISEHIQKVDAIKAVECFEKEKIYKKMGIPKEVKTIEVAIRKVNKFKDDYYPFTIGSKLIKVKRRKRCK